jgi:hypothetical protein
MQVSFSWRTHLRNQFFTCLKKMPSNAPPKWETHS